MKNKIVIYKYTEHISNNLPELLEYWFLYGELVSNTLIVEK